MRLLLLILLVVSGCAPGIEIGFNAQAITLAQLSKIAPQQPAQGTVRYWLSPGVSRYEPATNQAAQLLKVMGWKMIQTWSWQDAQVFLEPGGSDICADGKIARTVESCGSIKLCVGHRQLDAQAIAHEMAHTLGVGHAVGWGIMLPQKSTAPAFTFDDLIKFQNRSKTFSIFATFNGLPSCQYVPK